jgi:imidazolonepropionase-like amidohydrolase
MTQRVVRAPRLFDGERFVDGGVSVLVEGATIIGVDHGHSAVPQGTQIEEFEDATITPGLIDTHVHLVGDSRMAALDRVAGYSEAEVDAVITEALRAQLAAGVTTVRDLGDRRWCVIERRDRQRFSASADEPTILGSGPPVTSRGGHCWYMGGEVDGPDGITAAVAERASRGVDVVKVMASGGMTTPGNDVMRTQFPSEDLRSLVQQAHASGLPVTAHAHGLPAVEQAVAEGVDQIEHCSCLTESGVEASDQLLASIADKAIMVGGALGFPTQESMARAPAAVQQMMQRAGITFESVREMRLALIARMHLAGIALVAGADSGISSGQVHGGIVKAVRAFAEAGVSTEIALGSATAVAAKACGLGARKGQIRVGYDADLIVVDGNLRTHLENLSQVKAVLLKGRRVASPPPPGTR